MKPDYEQIIDTKQRSFTSKKVKRKNRPLLTAAWHFHPEIEICFTQKSNGKRYVGNNISDYYEGDLVMLGSHLPHGFTTLEVCKQTVIQMRYDFLGNHFFDQPELYQIKKLISNSKMGLQFFGHTNIKAQKIIKSIMKHHGMQRLIYLFELLMLLSNSAEFKTICSKEYSTNINPDQLSRMKTVLNFIESNFQEDISISDAAKIINLTDSAFYKFIKRHTKKRFTEILNEYRINHASKKLINTQMTIAEICFDSGFSNLSYFNREFKDILKSSPSVFRAQYQ